MSGRRRQGKSFLLQALAEAAGGMYFAATEATEAESLRLFTEALARHTGDFIEAPFRDWNDAIAHMFRSFSDRPILVAIDEFPFLSKTSPALPSIIQRELGPGGSGRTSSARLVLCGSAMSVMGGLLAGQAPLRGRASLELVVQPFRYRESAEFWGITDPRLAVLVHAVVGGTPAYRYEYTQGDAPVAIGPAPARPRSIPDRRATDHVLRGDHAQTLGRTGDPPRRAGLDDNPAYLPHPGRRPALRGLVPGLCPGVR
jgi:AAA+ ATPase superfamily predicted ATPase